MFVSKGSKNNWLIEDLCSENSQELMERRILAQKTVIFCRTSKQCVQFFFVAKEITWSKPH